MRKKKLYLKAGLFFLAFSFLIVMYPIASYYFSIYLGSDHAVHKPGSSFTYAGNLITRNYVYHFEVLENGSYNFTAIMYRGLPLPGYGYSQRKSPPKDWRWPFFGPKNQSVIKVCEINRILPPNDSLVQLLFPADDSVYIFNKTRRIVKLRGFSEGGYINWYFLPHYLGFPQLYAPEGLERFNRTLALKFNTTEYFPVIRYLKGSDGYYSIGVVPSTPENLKLLQLQRFFNQSCIGVNLSMYLRGGFPEMMLVKTNVQPVSQDWLRAIKWSATHYTAPVDYVFALAGIVLLILAGRVKG
ncbi:hypothetical protein [Thermococcus sp. AM4]|uniref:hypothetical protein n=1 Tax=Thermococcus sp. (strain AM4) TaxID=246969 RepID=UPI000187012D|nr:hypothetical protein [Thermococcus sp. AM4]